MYKYAIRWLCAIALLVSAGSARATFHLWQLNEIYSNADGTVQFIELSTGVGGQQFLTGHTITSSQGATTRSYTFPSDLPGDSAGRTFLIGTTGFAALGLVTPDYIVPNGFLFTTNGSVNFAGVDSVSWTALPVDGVMSINRFGAMGINSPTNFAGTTGSVPASSSPTCTLTASPASITAGGTSTLTASCNPAATSYVWTGGTCADTIGASCTVTPSASTTYTVAGINGFGTGAAASATVTVTPSTSLLTVTRSGPGTGAITSSPAGINCGATCSGSFTSGTSVTLTATPDASSTFSGWSGACTGAGSCVVSMTAAMSVTATFALSGPFNANVSAVVTGYYETILGREPDAAGLAYWIGEANRVVSLGADVREVFFAMSIDFFNSQEYRNRATDNTQYLTDLYRTFFIRQPDPAGLAFWLDFLNQGMDRGALLTNFLFSTEFSNQMTSLFGVSNPRAEINLTIDLYRGILGRLPDSAGFNFYLGRVRTAQCQGTFAVQTEINNMAAYFLSSPEYGNIDTARAPAERTPRHVGDLYNAFLRRGADLAGYLFYVGQLNSGAQTRDQVRLAFVQSPEFQNRLNAVIAAGCLPGY